jgi:hypothetical protein
VLCAGHVLSLEACLKEGAAVKNRSVLSQDNLVVSLGLATAIAILIAAVGGIWMWSSILEHAAEVTVERDLGLP